MKQSLIAYAIILLAICSCSKESERNTAIPPYPTTNIKVGSKFVYTMTDYDDTTGSIVRNITEITYTIARDSTINNEKWLVIAATSGPSTLGTSVIKVASDGFYTWVNSAQQLEFKFGSINESYSIKFSDNTTAIRKILATDELVTVPAGTFKAYKTEDQDSNSIEDHHWYNKDQFLIKQVEYDANPMNATQTIVDYKMELKSYTL